MLASVVKRVGMYANKRSGAVKFELVPALGIKITASSTENGEAREVIECEVESAGARVGHVGIDYRYVLDLLATFDKGESVKIMVRDGQSAILWRPISNERGGEYRTDYVIMPMRI
jgi:DNA polymerase III sliding clamp (beta) subunit (PCNA family)